MNNLLEGVKNLFTDPIIEKLSDVIGTEKNLTKSSIDQFVPAIIGRLANKGDNASGAVSLLDLFNQNNLGEDRINDLKGILSDKDRTNDFIQLGAQLKDAIFGQNQNALLDNLIEITGIKKAGGSMLMKFLVPVVLNKLAGLAVENNWSASKLSSYLSQQKSIVNPLISSFADIPGFKSETYSQEPESSTRSNLGWLGWLLLLIAGLALLYFLTRNGFTGSMTSDSEIKDSITQNKTTNSTLNGLGESNASISEGEQNKETEITSSGYNSYSLNKDGDLVDGKGYIILNSNDYYLDSEGNLRNSSGSILITNESMPEDLYLELKEQLGKYAGTKLSIDEKGNLVDPEGNIVYAKGEFEERDGYYYDMEGNKIGKRWQQIMNAVKNGMENTVDSMKEFFNNMLSKEENNVTYELTDIEFDDEGYRISNFNKSELEGLADALKSYNEGKVTVRAYTNSGQNNRNNKEISNSRAQVVHDMLVALGVDDKQISAEGLGSSDEAKAAADKIEIVKG